MGWLALLALLLAGCQPWRADDVVELRTATRIEHTAQGPPRMRQVDLPDSWSTQPATGSGYATYLFHIARDPQRRAQALLIPRVGEAASVRLNGAEIGRIELPPTVIEDIGFEPQMLFLPGPLLDEDNQLEIRVAGRGAGAGLSRVLVGPTGQIERLFSLRWSLSVGLTMIMLTTSAFMILFMVLLWRGTRRTLFLLFAAAAAALAVYAGALLAWEGEPVGWLRAGVLLLAYHTGVVLVALCTGRILGIESARLRAVLWGYWLGIAAALALSAALDSLQPYRVVRLVSLVALAGSVGLALRAARHRQSPLTWLLVGAALLGIALGTHQAIGDLVGRSRFGELPVQRTMTLALVVLVIIYTIEQYNANFRAMQHLNATLERRVSAAQAELTRTFESLRQAELSTAVEQERRRLMRDIHDGLGSQLLSTLSLAQKPDVERHRLVESVGHCITELRVAIDSLEPFDDDLLAALGTLRLRVAPLLERSGVQLTWRVRELPEPLRLTAADVGEVFRILLEAFSNIVKHSQATRAALHCSGSRWRGVVWISLSDDGRGLPPAGERRMGRGLVNMQERAARIGAQVLLRRRPQGTLVRLIWAAEAGPTRPPA